MKKLIRLLGFLELHDNCPEPLNQSGEELILLLSTPPQIIQSNLFPNSIKPLAEQPTQQFPGLDRLGF